MACFVTVTACSWRALAFAADYYSDFSTCLAFRDFITYSDFVLTSVFVLEFMLRSVAHGFAFTPNAYLKSAWNCLDFVIVVVSVTSVALSSVSSLAALRSLRVLRALRPLRVVQHYPGLRLVVNSIISSVPRVKNVFILNIFFIFIFAVIGTQVHVQSDSESWYHCRYCHFGGLS